MTFFLGNVFFEQTLFSHSILFTSHSILFNSHSILFTITCISVTGGITMIKR